MWILQPRLDYERIGAEKVNSESDQGSDKRISGRQSVPMYRLSGTVPGSDEILWNRGGTMINGKYQICQ